MNAELTGQMPISARVHLAHALVERIAADAGVDLLHLKGPALLPGLRPPGRHSTDVDVLVRPSHLPRLITRLEAYGWEQRTDFSTGSVFAHAANWWHDDWGWVDVHVRWPGVNLDPEQAFDTLAGTAQSHLIAHVGCLVPDRTGQILILVLHAARSRSNTEVDYFWPGTSPAERDEVRALAATLGAQVALAAGLGELEDFRGDRTYALWHHLRHGGSRFAEWRARLAAAPNFSARVRLATGVFRVNQDHLRMELGRPPTRADMRTRQLLRVRRAAREVAQRLRRP